MSSPGGWTKASNAILADPNLKAPTKLVLFAIASYLREGQGDMVQVGYADIATRAGVSRSTVKRAIVELRTAGLLEWRTSRVEGRKENDANTYLMTAYRALISPRGGVNETPPRSSPTPPESDGRASQTLGGGSSGTPGGRAQLDRKREDAPKDVEDQQQVGTDPLDRFDFSPTERAKFIQSLNAKSPGGLIRVLDQRGELDQRVTDFRSANAPARPDASFWSKRVTDPYGFAQSEAEKVAHERAHDMRINQWRYR